MTKTSPQPFSRKQLRRALRAWEQSASLGANPLAGLQVVETERQDAGYADTPTGLGMALRRVLQSALDRLRPGTGDPEPVDEAWRDYLILTEQYIQGRDREYVARQLHLALSTYSHAQASALDRVLEYLKEWEESGTLSPGVAPAITSRRLEGPPRPFMAPPRIMPGLVGRDELLLELKRLLLDGEPAPSVALHGLPGVGKSALAIELCHDPEVRERYPDGVLWAGLGPSPDPGVLLHLWQLALGFGPDELAGLPGVRERAKAIHAAIGMRRMLLVLDDVWQVESAHALLVGGPHCASLFTTRMPGLAHDLGAASAVAVPELDPAAALELLQGLTPELVRKLRHRANELVDASGGLPLAIELLGRTLRKELYSRQPRRLIEALENLRDPSVRLRVERRRPAVEQQPGLPPDTAESLEAVIALSDKALDEDARLALYALSAFPPKPSSFDEPAAAAVSNTPSQAIDRLVDAGLLESVESGRYAIQRTIADYGRLRLADDRPFRAFVSYFLDFIERTQGDFPKLGREIHNLLAAMKAEPGPEPAPQYVRAAIALFPYLESAGLLDQAEAVLNRAREAAHESDGLALAEVLLNLGKTALRQGKLADAAARFNEALDIARAAKGVEIRCACLQGLGSVALSQGNNAGAEARYLKALKLADRAGLRARQAALLSNLGMLASKQGDAAAAERRFSRGLALARESGDSSLVGALLTNLGVIVAQAGRLEQAERLLQESMDLAQAAGNRRATLFLLMNLGALAHDQGDDLRAQAYFEQALDHAREIGDQAHISQILANLGALATGRRDFDLAEALMQEGLALAQALGHRDNLALLGINLGQLCKERGDLAGALHSTGEALERAVEAGHRRYSAIARTYVGELHRMSGDLEEAEKTLQTALAEAEQLGMPALQADALYGLAKVESALGRPDLARQWGERALELFISTGNRKALEVEAWLEQAGPVPPG